MGTMTKLVAGLALAIAFAVVGAPAAAADSGYTLTILGTLGGCCSQAWVKGVKTPIRG